MGLFNIIKRKEVPAELPNLAINSAGNQKSPSIEQNLKEAPVISAVQSELSKVSQAPQTQVKYKPLPVQRITLPEKIEKPKIEAEDEKGFFRELIKGLTDEINESKLDKLYKNRLLSEDIVYQMKEYWQKQKPEILLKNVGNDLKIQLLEKTDKLHSLEKEWQDTYFSLLAKEDKIREEEKELKSILSELMDLYERSIKNQADKAEESKKKSSS